MFAELKDPVMKNGTTKRGWVLFGSEWGWASVAKIAMIVVLLVWPLIYTQLTDSNYALNVMTQAGLYAILTISVGLVLGQAGQLSFGHSAFYGIGAYVCGLLVLKFGVPTLLAWVAGAAAAGLVALIVGRPVLKLKYFYLALGHHGPGADIPGGRVRMEMGRCLQRLWTGLTVEYLRVRVRYPAAQVLHGVGGRHHHSPVRGAPSQVPGG